MITKIDKNAVRQRRHARVRKTITGTAEAPRMNVYRSLNHIYVQIIDDRKGNEKGGVTLAAASTMDKAVKEQIAGLTKTAAAKVVGKVAKKNFVGLAAESESATPLPKVNVMYGTAFSEALTSGDAPFADKENVPAIFSPPLASSLMLLRVTSLPYSSTHK